MKWNFVGDLESGPEIFVVPAASTITFHTFQAFQIIINHPCFWHYFRICRDGKLP